MSTSGTAFLSHNSSDKPFVEAVARSLEGRGVNCWLDMWNLIPGQEWQEEIEAELEHCASCVVFLGPGGISSWQHEEMRRAIARRVENRDEKFRVIPVMLPGVDPAKRSELPDFLTRTTWVEFAQSANEEAALDRLVAGILGQPPKAVARIDSTRCPYLGLDAFHAEQADLYFGREADVQWLVNQLKDTRFLAIVGASGSGKSSLARAGLVPDLAEQDWSSHWPVVVLRPGPRPLESLATALAKAGLCQNPGTLQEEMTTRDNRLHLTVRQAVDEEAKPEQRVLLVVDQFEEVFTVCDDEIRRKGFIDNLLYAATIAGGRTVVVPTMRADFYPQCLGYPQLAAALSDSQLAVGAMDRENLREVITQPAAMVGCEFEPGLVELLLDDMEDQPPGALPLLQHCLKQLWERREDGRRLTVAAYKGKEIGGISGALEKHADRIFENLSPKEQEACAALFTRLVRPGEGAADTKRIEQLAKAAPDDISRNLVEIMSAQDARLLTADDSGVEITHEALIRSWGELRKWVERDRKWILVEQRLAEDAKHWKDKGEKSKFLYSGARLEDAKEWMKRNRKAAGQFGLETRFVKKSVARANRRLQLMVTATIGSLLLAFAAFWMTERALASREQAYVKDAEGALALAKVAKMEGNVYPDQIFHKARAIGFAGFGREQAEDAGWKTALQTRLNLLLGKEEPFPVLLKSNPERFDDVTKDLAETPAVLPFWRTEPVDSAVKTIAVSEDGNQVTAAFADGSVRQWDLSQPDPGPVQQQGGKEMTAVPVPVELLNDSVKVSIPGEDITLKQPGKPVAAGLDFVGSNLYVGLADGSLAGWNISGRPVGSGRKLTRYFGSGQAWVDFAKNSTEITMRNDGTPGFAAEAKSALEVQALPESPKPRDQFINSIGMELVFLPPGTFWMGSPDDEADRSSSEVRHEVELTRGFWLGKYEVTQREWIALMGKNPSSFPNLYAPVEKVSWNEVTEFCDKLTEREHHSGGLDKGWKYSLPTEAQWEYACRAGTETPFFWGTTLNGKRANCDGTNPYGTEISGPYLQRTSTVGSYRANSWGLYDMHGNVYEWCLDWYGEYEVGKPDPHGPASGESRVFRGGSWDGRARLCRSANRYGNDPENSNDHIGFRVATVPKQPDAERTERPAGEEPEATKEPGSRRPGVE